MLLPLVGEMAPSWQPEAVVGEIPTFSITIEDEYVVTPEQSKSIDRWRVSKMVWCAGVVITGVVLLVGLARILMIRRRSHRRRLPDGVTLYLTREEIAPFTFGKDIYIPHSLSDPKIINSILQHELEHIRQRHYIDVLLGCILQLVQWWNPFTWSMLQQQRNTLEYLADQGVLRKGKDRKTYQYHLLECTVGRSTHLPSLSFSMQNLKQRIFMMNSSKKSPGYLAIIYAMAALPIAALLLVGTQMVTIERAMASEVVQMTPPPTEDNEIYEYVEIMPEFPGGQSALIKWLGDNVKYPTEAVDKKIKGRVMVNFVVEKDGSISNVGVAKGVHKLLDDEAVRVVTAMPKWKPGTTKGKEIRTRFMLPISFAMISKADTKSGENKKASDEVIKSVPEFVGGHLQMMKWLSENIHYPEEAVKNNIQGRVVVSFIVNTDGSLSDVKVARGVHALLDAEAVRVVTQMPRWNPGTNHAGDAVKCQFTIPVQFKLPGEENDTPKQDSTTP